MADNFPLTPGTGRNAATDQVTYSGDTADVQLIKLVQVSGTEGAKSVVDLPGDTANGLDTDVTRVPADPFGLNADAASGTGSVSAKLRQLASTVFVDETTFTVASSKVNAIGLHAVASGGAPDAAPLDGAVNPVTNRNRVPFTIGGDPGTITTKHANITAAVTDAAIVTVTGGNKIVVTRITMTLDNASTTFPAVAIGFGATITPTVGPGALAGHPGVPAGGGFTIGDGSGILGIGGDGEDLRITTVGTAGGNGLYVFITYHLVPS